MTRILLAALALSACAPVMVPIPPHVSAWETDAYLEGLGYPTDTCARRVVRDQMWGVC